jgi:S-adenosylmethionine:tRNA ribosyltransferase-isomerase
MRTDLFDFNLPPERIALRPASPRDAARLLVVRPGATAPFEDRGVRDLPELLRPGDALVVNDTRVIPARLTGQRIGRGADAKIEATLHQRLDGSRWRAFVRPAKRLAPGDMLRFGDEGKVCFLGQLDATVEAKDAGGEVTLAFAFHGAVLDQAIEERGAMPLPPYIASRRAPDEQDRDDYQTMFSQAEGSVAAPTAGLHFTPELIERLKARGVSLHKVTLHVGAATFLPVKSADTADHRMQAEAGSVSDETAAALNAARNGGGRLVAVGSTALRICRGDRDLHHAGLSLSRGRRDGDQLPPVALDLVHAGRSLFRARRDEARLCACARQRLSVLLVRRRVSLVSGGEQFLRRRCEHARSTTQRFRASPENSAGR